MLCRIEFHNQKQDDTNTFEIELSSVPRASETIIVDRNVGDGSYSKRNLAEQEAATGFEYYWVEKVEWYMRVSDYGDSDIRDAVTPVLICKPIQGRNASQRHKENMLRDASD